TESKIKEATHARTRIFRRARGKSALSSTGEAQRKLRKVFGELKCLPRLRHASHASCRRPLVRDAALARAALHTRESGARGRRPAPGRIAEARWPAIRPCRQRPRFLIRPECPACRMASPRPA